MVKLRDVKIMCWNELANNLGLTCNIDRIIVEDFEVCGEKENILVSASFSVYGVSNIVYEVNFLNGDFVITSKHYDERLVVN